MASLTRWLATSSIALCGFAMADPGAIDAYECHNDQTTGKYHCHGAENLAKLGGFNVFAQSRGLAWRAGDDLYAFGGLAVGAEVNYRIAAITASVYQRRMITAISNDSISYDEGIQMSGWDVSAKVGYGVGRYGFKAYGEGGWSSAEVTVANDSSGNGTISGYFAGAGLGYHTNRLAIDFGLYYVDPSDVEAYLSDTQSINEDVLAIESRLSLGLRF